MSSASFPNPFRPGAGHMPPYLAGRQMETEDFRRLLRQEVVTENMILTGLRGVGKTVLLDTFKPVAIEEGWLWVGTDLSESTSLSEERIAIRLMADLSVVTSTVVVAQREVREVGFTGAASVVDQRLGFELMKALYDQVPGLPADKIKAVLEFVWGALRPRKSRGIVFAYDEAQNLSDHAAKDEYPLSMMLDVFQSIQRKGIPFMLAMAGLPTLFPKLVEARTFAERMFHVVFLDRLDEAASREAILKPIESNRCPLTLKEPSIKLIVDVSGGYPYFIQFICREVYDTFLQRLNDGATPRVPVAEILRKLDADFFAGRWARATDRQRELLSVIAHLDDGDEFTVQEIATKSRELLSKPFSPSHINQMLVALADAGLIFKNRHGKYSFAVPLFDQFIKRQETPARTLS